jgi:TonB-dependent starch-binding outer membrane protein SusC
MRLVTFLLLVTFLNVLADKTYSQNAPLSIEMYNTSIQKVLQNIESQSESFFMYSSKMIDVNQKVNIRVVEADMTEVLDKLLANTGIEYSVKGRQILLYDKDSDKTINNQQETITGRIIDSQTGEGMPGVNVLVKGTTTGAISSADGRYSLRVADRNATLVFSFIGYVNQEIPINNRMVVDVALIAEMLGLDEVIVVGYGSMSKKEISSSIVSVNNEEFQKGAVSDPMELLVGKVAGLNIDRSSASPHSTSSFQIRGATSITGGNSPLIVIDGVAGGNMGTLATQDIESITVLKDAASAAIYGTRGANGVVLITTKIGSEAGRGSYDVTYNSYFSANLMHELPESLGYNEYRERARGIDYGYQDDWLGALKRDFSYNNNQYLSISGSSDKSRYSISLNYIDMTALDKANESTRYGVRFVHTQKTLNDLLEIGTTMNVRATDAKTGSNGIPGTVFMNPTQPIWNDDGTYNHPTTSTGATNAVENANTITNGNNTVFVTGTLQARLQLIKNYNHTLNTSANYTVDFNNNKAHYHLPSTHATSEWNGYKGSASLSSSRNWNKQFEWTANYSFIRGKSFAERCWWVFILRKFRRIYVNG